MKTMMAVLTNSEWLFQDFVLNHKHPGDKAVLITKGNIVVNLEHQYTRVTNILQILGRRWTGYHDIYDFHYDPNRQEIIHNIKRCYDNSNFSETFDSSPLHKNSK